MQKQEVNPRDNRESNTGAGDRNTDEDKENTAERYCSDHHLRESYVRLERRADVVSACEAFDPDEVIRDRNVLIEECSDLPPGWTRVKIRRINGLYKGNYDRYIVSPEGRKLKSQRVVDDYLHSANLDLDISFRPTECSFDDKKSKQSSINNYHTTNKNNMGRALRGSKNEKKEGDEEHNEMNGFNHKQSSVKRSNSYDESHESTAKRKKPNIIKSLVSEALNTSEVSEEASDAELNSTLKSDCNNQGVNIPEELIEEVVSEPKDDHSDLPPGWSRLEVTKAFSKSELVVVVQSPDGKQFDSQRKLNAYIARNKLDVKIDFVGPVKKIVEDKPEEEADEVVETEHNPEEAKTERVKKERTEETDRTLTNDDIDEECDREFSEEEINYIKKINTFLSKTCVQLRASPATKGDGNCWFRAVADQVVILDIPDKARNHRALRLEV